MRKLFVFLLICQASTYAGVQFSSVGLRVGQARPNIHNRNTNAFGVQTNIKMAGTELLLAPFFDYWSMSYKKNTSENWNWKLFTLGLSALKPFNLNNSRAVPYIGGGLGFIINAWQVSDATDPALPKDKDSEFDLALNVTAGVAVPFNSQLNGLIELKYTLAGIADYFGFWIGLSYQLTRN